MGTCLRSTCPAAPRKGETKWEDLDLDDIDVRLKWSGMFHRRKRAPGTFMMRLKVQINLSMSLHSWHADIALPRFLHVITGVFWPILSTLQ